MPTAFEYDWWAGWFAERADEMSTLLNSALGAATADVLAGGFLAVTVDISLRAAADNATSVSGRFTDLSDECIRRAQVCRDYDTAMSRYESADAAYDQAIVRYADQAEAAAQQNRPFFGSPPQAPVRPAAPPAWVERSRE